MFTYVLSMVIIYFRYEALKREAEGPAQSDLLREIDKLKRETGFSPDPNKLKQVKKYTYLWYEIHLYKH